MTHRETNPGTHSIVNLWATDNNHLSEMIYDLAMKGASQFCILRDDNGWVISFNAGPSTAKE